MRKGMLIANGVVAAFFVCFFAYSFFAQRHIDRLARDFVMAKTQKYAAPIVDVAEEAVKSPIVRRLLNHDQVDAFEREIGEYRSSPRDYIAALTARKIPAQVEGRFKNPLVGKITQWKERIRAYFDKVLLRLMWDLRIFSGSNVVAAALACWLAYRGKEKTSKKLAWMSLLLLVSMGLSVLLYIDSFSFFTILFDAYLGWWYPVLLGIVFLGLYLQYDRAPAAREFSPLASSGLPAVN